MLLACFHDLSWVYRLQKKRTANQSAVVNVPVPDEVYDAADRELRISLNNLIKTNIVCTAIMFRRADLRKIVQVLGGCYIRSKFPSASGDVCNPRGSWTLFPALYIRCAGSNTREAAQWIIYWLCFQLNRGLGIPFGIFNFVVQNHVSATTLPYGVNLDKFQREMKGQVKYVPDMFPGAILRLKQPHQLVVQTFDSGKVNLVGAKTLREPVTTLVGLEPKLRRCAIRSFSCAGLTPGLSAVDVQNQLAAALGRDLELISSELRQKKKLEKLRKDKSKIVRQNASALSSWHQQCGSKKKNKRKRLTGSSSSSSAEDIVADDSQDLTEDEIQLLKTIKDMSDFVQRNDDPEQNRIFCMLLTVDAKQYEIELLFDKTILVLDADDDQEVGAVRTVIEGALCMNIERALVTAGA